MRWKRWVPAVLGTLTALGALVVGLTVAPSTGSELPVVFATVVGLAIAVLALVKLVRDPSDESTAPPPWSEDGTLVDDRPESTPKTDRISGTALTERIESAATEVKAAETFREGVGPVREPLRDALIATLRRAGWDDADIQAALESGAWTDDRAAAALLDDAVRPPERSLRRRVWAWLFPEKAVRHRTALAVGAIARVAESELPPVVGQHAPRPVPVLEPTLDDLQRAADGELRRAVDGSAAVREPPVDATPDDDRADADDDADTDAGDPGPREAAAGTDAEDESQPAAGTTTDGVWATEEGD